MCDYNIKLTSVYHRRWPYLKVKFSGHILVCYRANVCSTQKFICWNPNFQSDRIREREDSSSAFMNGITAIIKETLEDSLALWRRRPGMKQEAGPHQAESTCNLKLGFPATRTFRNIILLLLSPCCFVKIMWID